VAQAEGLDLHIVSFAESREERVEQEEVK